MKDNNTSNIVEFSAEATKRLNNPPAASSIIDSDQRSATAEDIAEMSFVIEAIAKKIEAEEVIATHKGQATTKLIQAVLCIMGVDVSYNIATRKMEIEGVSVEHSKVEASNTLPVLVMDYLTEKGKRVSLSAVIQRLHVIADLNRFNPVIDMLTKTEYDGVNRIDQVFEMLGLSDKNSESKEEAEKKARYRLYVTKWLHQCVAMALNNDEEPYGADGILVLQGEQGIGKTLFFRTLAVESLWFGEGISLNMKNKDKKILATGKWIAELGELDDTLAHKQSSFKAFLTSERDEIRSPYARTAVNKPRRTSFCGTVNPERFLTDETGSRRFWVVKVHDIDVDRLLQLDKEWLYQLWAQVYQELYLKDPQGFRLTQAEQKQLQEDNLEFLLPMTGEVEILESLCWDAPIEHWRYVQATELAKAVGGINPSQTGKVLRRLQRRDHRIKVTKAHNNIVRYFLPPIVG